MSFIDDIVAKGYGGYRGWDEQSAQEDYKKTGGQGKYDPGSSQQYAQQTGQSYTPQGAATQPFQDMVSQTQEMYKKAAEPAISSLEASKPEITKSISSKMDVLKSKYDNLISSITGNQAKAENRQTVVTAGELGKRGIDPTSTLYGQELTNAVNPITAQYTGLEKEATGSLQSGVQDLASMETEQIRNVNNAIAQLQMGASDNSIATALQLYQQAQTASQNATNLDESKRQSDIANALQQKIYETIQLPESQMNVANAQSLINERGSTSSSGGDWQSYYETPGAYTTNVNRNLQSSQNGTWLPQSNSGWSIIQ